MKSEEEEKNPSEEKDPLQAENSSEGLATFLTEMAEHNEKIAEEAQAIPEEEQEGESAESKARRLKKKKEDEGEELAAAG